MQFFSRRKPVFRVIFLFFDKLARFLLTCFLELKLTEVILIKKYNFWKK